MPLQQSQQLGGFAARAISGVGTTTSPGVNIAGVVDWVAIEVALSAVGGTGSPTLTLSVQWSQDQGATWADADTADTFTAITLSGTPAVVKRFPAKGHYFRLKEVLAGTTPSATYTCTALVG